MGVFVIVYRVTFLLKHHVFIGRGLTVVLRNESNSMPYEEHAGPLDPPPIEAEALDELRCDENQAAPEYEQKSKRCSAIQFRWGFPWKVTVTDSIHFMPGCCKSERTGIFRV